jgi:ketosteroid isomerase-like protein
MATDPNFALIQSAFADFQKGDIASLLHRLTDDAAWTTPYPPEIVPHGGNRTGKDGVLTFFEQLARVYEITAAEDVTQMFLKLWTNAGTFRGGAR